MKHDVSQPISQGKHGANAPHASRMEEVANLLYSCCRKNEEEPHSGTAYRGNLYSEQDFIEKYAEDNHCWYSLDDVFDLGIPGPSGSENDTYVDKKDYIVYKLNNLIHTGSFYKLFHRLSIHNALFPQTEYKLFGFTGYKGRTIYPILTQPYIDNAIPALPEEIDSYMKTLGFEKISDWTYQYGNIILSDLKPKNVLKVKSGDLYVIDAEIKEIK